MSDKRNSKTERAERFSFGDIIRGDVIYMEGQKIELLVHPSSGATARHGAQKARAETNAMAKIEKPFRKGPFIRH